MTRVLALLGVLALVGTGFLVGMAWASRWTWPDDDDDELAQPWGDA